MLRSLIFGLGVIAVAAAAVAATGNATEGRERNKRCKNIRIFINILLTVLLIRFSVLHLPSRPVPRKSQTLIPRWGRALVATIGKFAVESLV